VKLKLPNDIKDAVIPGGNTNTVIVTPTDTPTPTVTATVTPRPKTSHDSFGGTRWPADAIIPDTWIADAARARATHHLRDIDLRLEAERFANYWASKSGGDAAKLDWKKTWINWVLRAEGARDGKTHDGRKSNAHDKFFAGAAAFIRDELAGTEPATEGDGGGSAFAPRHPLLPP
jgi:hypothetical protein